MLHFHNKIKSLLETIIHQLEVQNEKKINKQKVLTRMLVSQEYLLHCCDCGNWSKHFPDLTGTAPKR